MGLVTSGHTTFTIVDDGHDEIEVQTRAAAVTVGDGVGRHVTQRKGTIGLRTPAMAWDGMAGAKP